MQLFLLWVFLFFFMCLQLLDKDSKCVCPYLYGGVLKCSLISPSNASICLDMTVHCWRHVFFSMAAHKGETQMGFDFVMVMGD